MKEIRLFPKTGAFAENKDIARDMRLNEIQPALDSGDEVTIDFRGIDAATQSFIHALISDLIRKHGIGVLDSVYFKNCSKTVRKIIEMVVDYMQDSD